MSDADGAFVKFMDDEIAASRQLVTTCAELLRAYLGALIAGNEGVALATLTRKEMSRFATLTGNAAGMVEMRRRWIDSRSPVATNAVNP